MAFKRMDNEILLQTLLHELQDGVIVCDVDARIALFNQAAADFFGKDQAISNGDSLFSHFLKSPVEHALDFLHYQQQDTENDHERPPCIQFMNATPKQEKYFRCRLSLSPSHTGNNIFFILIFDTKLFHGIVKKCFSCAAFQVISNSGNYKTN